MFPYSAEAAIDKSFTKRGVLHEAIVQCKYFTI